MSDLTLAFLGAGSMNGSILRGVLNAGHAASAVRATTHSADSAHKLAEETGVRVYSAQENPQANSTALKGADIALIGVKPYAVLDMAREIAPTLDPGTVVVSVAAGITLGAMEKVLPPGQPVVRSMPNTPSSVGKGVIAVAGGSHATAEQMQQVKDVLSTVGTVVEVEEHLLGAVTGVSGSGPAYAFYLAEAMQQAGEALGLPSDVARVLAKETVSGAGVLLEPDDAVPADLRAKVTSPGGTTAAAIATFEDRGMRKLIADAVAASAARSDEMQREYCGD